VTLAALTTTVCRDPLVGARYRPPEVIEPKAGLTLHVTPELGELLTVATNCCVCPNATVADAGVTRTLTVGVTCTVALAAFDGSLTLVAVTMT